MNILAIETSCDETAVAVVRRGEEPEGVLAEEVKSQIPLHASYGGIVPEIASRSHCEVIDRLCSNALKNAGVAIDDIGLIAFTQGPGLIGSLLIGLSFAKGLSYAQRLPLVPVDHIQSHVESAFITHRDIEYPLLALVVSGGHTTLFHYRDKFDFRVAAKTRDDAVGEVMDKIAKFFGLGYPGGPVLDRLYEKGNPRRYSFTMPRITDGGTDFSFSGYKTAILRMAEKEKIEPETQAYYDLLSSFSSALVEYLLKKVDEAQAAYPARSLIVSGGVSRNSLLRKRFTEECARRGVRLYMPELRYCTDNAAMVGWLGYEIYRRFPGEDYFSLEVSSYCRAPFRDRGKHR